MVAAAAAAVQPQQSKHSTSSVQQPSALDKQHHAVVKTYLEQLSAEQRLAAYSPEQHVRVIAGPGSGKTRVLAARVAHLIACGAAPESLLVITFTRKAAGELLQRLKELLGDEATGRLRPSTFHSLCTNLLRRYRQYTRMPDFQVASEEDTEDMVQAILSNEKFKEQLDGSTRDIKVRDEARFYRKHISNMKNFCVNIDRHSGAELIAEMATAGSIIPGGSSKDITRRVAAMYDMYVARMAAEQLLDFDDLLHHCLALLKNNPGVKARVHGRWAHVMVDESQDTNRCQFELVRELVSPSCNLFMVGDPYQAIYGFRGANSALLSEHFTKVYGPTAATRLLHENYRCREPIVAVADIVRLHGRRLDGLAAAGRCKQPQVEDSTVVLMEANNEHDEADQVVLQLREWHKAGYVWGEMAVLFRNKAHGEVVYRKAIADGIPCHVWSNADFFDAAEVKVALALLRCLVDPQRASEAIRKRLVKKGSSFKVPLMAGLGDKTFDNLSEAIAGNLASGSSSSTGQPLQPSLGSCLLGDLPFELTAQEAVAHLEQWTAATAAGTDSSEALQRLASPWQPPGGIKPTKRLQAAVERLRGLVLLGRATAVAASPAGVMQLLLEASGVLPELQGALEAAEVQRHSSTKGQGLRRTLSRRLGNLRTLIKLARNTEAYSQSPVLDLEDAFDAAGGSGGGAGSYASTSSSSHSSRHGQPLNGNSSSSSSSSSSGNSQLQLLQPTTGLPLLQQLYDYCVLQGEGDEDAADAEKVQLMTMHTSKGKEFCCVSVLHAHDGAIPFIRRDESSSGSLEQERNLLYVAVTRAKEHCFLTWPKEKYSHDGAGDRLQPSRFLKPVLAAIAKRQLPRVQLIKRRYIDWKPPPENGWCSRR